MFRLGIPLIGVFLREVKVKVRVKVRTGELTRSVMRFLELLYTRGS